MRHNDGLTLVEVLVALVILAVGVIAAATMQTNALRVTNRTNVSQQLTKLANAELEMQRQLATPANKTTCLSGSSTGYSCITTVVPCSVSGTSILCSPSTATSSRVAYRVTVDVSGPRNATFSIISLIPFNASSA